MFSNNLLTGYPLAPQAANVLYNTLCYSSSHSGAIPGARCYCTPKASSVHAPLLPMCLLTPSVGALRPVWVIYLSSTWEDLMVEFLTLWRIDGGRQDVWEPIISPRKAVSYQGSPYPGPAAFRGTKLNQVWSRTLFSQPLYFSFFVSSKVGVSDP